MRDLIERMAELICEPDFRREIVRGPFVFDGWHGKLCSISKDVE